MNGWTNLLKAPRALSVFFVVPHYILMADVKKQLSIKTNTCKRLHKDILSYEKESTQQQEKVNKLRSNAADSYDIKKQEEVLSESRAMVIDSKKRLETAYYDLSSFIGTLDSGSVDLTEANSTLETVKPLFV